LNASAPATKRGSARDSWKRNQERGEISPLEERGERREERGERREERGERREERGA
jgi:hypothetical protein